MKGAGRIVASVFIICGIAAASVWGQQRADAEKLRQRLIGTYKLVSYVGYDEKGGQTRQPYSVGQISYDAAGRMSAQLMRDTPPDAASAPPPAQLPQGQGRGQGRGQGQGQAGYIAYFGRYEIDAEKGIVYHIVEGSVSRNMLGQKMPRYFEFSADGGSLFLQTKTADGGRVTGRLQWDRHK